jgi:hypothetical protein
MGGQVEQGMSNIESFLHFKIGYSAFIIQYSLLGPGRRWPSPEYFMINQPIW